MGIIRRRYSWWDRLQQRDQAGASETKEVGLGTRKWRLTFLFVVTAMVVIAVASIIVNRVIGSLAEDNLLRIAEENTNRDALHILSMLRMMGPMEGTTSAHSTNRDSGMQEMQQPMALTLEYLASPGGLSSKYRMLVDGLNIVKIILFDTHGYAAWSTDVANLDMTKPKRKGSLYWDAVEGEVASKFVRDKEITDFDAEHRSLDIVETYMPLRDTPSGKIIGVMEVYRDVGSDVALQVDDARRVVLWTMVGTMGGLFIVLLGFIMVADVSIYRSNRRAMSVVQESNRTLEDRVHQRTQELEEANNQLIEAQDQLVRTEKLSAIGQLAGGVAHDLRNPLGAVKNAVYDLKRRLVTTEAAQSNPRIGQFLQIADDGVEHCNSIITDLLTFARVKAPSLFPINLGEMIENSVSSLEVRDNVQLINRLDPGVPEVMADGEQLYRVFMNLALNAQDAMPDGGELTISTRTIDGFAEVTFSDTGTGIDDETMKKVFEPLFTTKAKGTGLGLSVCQQIVSKHGGDMDVSSEYGKGSTFTVRLPLNQDKS